MAHLFLLIIVVLVCVIRSSHGSSVIVEEGIRTSIQCSLPTTVTNMTWQLVVAGGMNNISTCSGVENRCDNRNPSNYQAFIITSENAKVFGLNIISASKTETNFTCLGDNGLESSAILEVYVLPTVPYCSYEVNETYVEYTCRSVRAYPQVSATLHRMEKNLTQADFDPPYTKCQRYDNVNYQSGVNCTWRIPMKNMLLDSTMFVTMTIYVSNMSAVNTEPVVSSNFITTLRVPEVAKTLVSCPVGPGVFDGSIMIGTNATCSCDLEKDGNPPGMARWFTHDGKIVVTANQSKRQSTVTVSYNYSDPSPSYECRPVTGLAANVTSVWFTPIFIGDHKIAEITRPSNLECSIPSNVASITWQIRSGNSTTNISTCTLANGNCVETPQSIYRGSIKSSGSNPVVSLNITGVRRNETLFSCIADNGLKTNITQLRVYAWPQKPQCRQLVKDTYITYTCTTNSVYPELKCVLHRRGTDFLREDLSYNPPVHSLTTGGVFMATCSWDYHIIYRIHHMTVYVEMSAQVYNQSLVTNAPVFGDDIDTLLSAPVVALNTSACPIGPGVRGNTIRIGTIATCRCEMQTPGLPLGTLGWYTKYNKRAENETVYGRTSTITFSYNFIDKNQTYECRSISILEGNGTYATYTPVFVSSAETINMTIMHVLVVLLGAVCT